MKKTRIKKVVVLLSGGLDSTTIAYYASRWKSNLGNQVFLLTFNYGQKHKKELTSAIITSKKIKAKEHKIVELDLTLWGGSALTDVNINIPCSKNEITKPVPATYVPARNTIFLSVALAYAEAIKASEIYIGVNSVDYSGYVDCRPVFIKKFQELVKVATTCGVYGQPIKIQAPLINLSKSEIIKLGQKLGIDWKDTWSCYLGEKLACGLCDSCQLRLKGFMQAGLRDPLKYKNLPKFYKNFLKGK